MQSLHFRNRSLAKACCLGARPESVIERFGCCTATAPNATSLPDMSLVLLRILDHCDYSTSKWPPTVSRQPLQTGLSAPSRLYVFFHFSKLHINTRTDAEQELAFLTDAGMISKDQLAKWLVDLPQEESVNAPVPLQSGSVAAKMADLSVNGNSNGNGNARNSIQSPTPTAAPINNEKTGHWQPSPSPQPPAYSQAQQQAPTLAYATALYAYVPTDAGDLALSPNDRIAVTEYMNAEWWKGRCERTGQEGIFPRSYVRSEEKGMAPQSPPPQQQPQQSGGYYGPGPMPVDTGGYPGMAQPAPAGQSSFAQNGKVCHWIVLTENDD